MALLVGLALVAGALLGGGVPVPPSLMSRAKVVTPKQRSGTAKGRPHLVSSKQTTAKGDGKKRLPKRPKNAPPLEQPYKPQVVAKTSAKRPAPPNRVKVMPEREPAKVTGFDPQKSVEDPGQRDRFTYRYRNPDGTWTARVYTRPVNFRGANGAFQPIDAGLVDDGKGHWRNKADGSVLQFTGRASAQDLATMDLGGGKRFGFGLAGATAAQGRAQGDTVTYPAVRPDTDLVLQSLNGGSIKEKLVLRSADGASSWEFPLRTDGLTPRMTTDGSVEVVDAAGKVVVHIPHGFMVDSKIDPRSGDGARSEAVTYALEQRGGQWVLKVTADKQWLADPARVFPVIVDPTSVTNFNDTSDTYVQTGRGSSASTEDELRVGTFDGGSTKAATYLGFSQVDNNLSHSKIYDVDLFLMNAWSFSCKDAPVSVHPITQNWSHVSIAGYPGPSYGAALASRSFADGWTSGSGASSPCPAKWEGIDLGSGGNSLVQGWVDGTKANYGLTVRASTTSSSGWKKFASRETPNGPYMSIVYSPYNASYAFTSNPPTFSPAVLNNQAGYVKVNVTNKGHTTWTPTNGYKLAYGVFDTSGNQVYHVPAQTAMPHDVAYGDMETVNAKVNPLPPGTWTIKFDMVDNGKYFSDWGVARTAQVKVTVPDVPTQLNEMSPHNNFQVGSLTPQLFADAQSVDAWPSANVTYQFTVCAPPWITWEWCVNSPWQQTPKWTVPNTDPIKKLAWGKEYWWTVSVNDSGGATTNGPWYKFVTEVQQPEITSHLADSASAGQEFGHQAGNYITTATDAKVATVGPALDITRTYNSLDPRTTGLFGAGWSTRYDMKVVPDNDGSGNVVVTYPSGQEIRFAKDPSTGNFAAPTGTFATFSDVLFGAGGYKLRDKSATLYTFDSGGRLTSITDNRGRTETLTYGFTGHPDKVTSSNGRSLNFTWDFFNPTHVLTVSTDAVGGSPLTWTYTYTGDTLTKVCPPTSATACTTYSYGAGSHYRSTALDDNPVGYWRLNGNGTSAVSENLGADAATPTSLTYGTGALAGTTDTAGVFNGTSSRVRLPDRTISKQSGLLAVEAWFKTSGHGTILAYQNAAAGSTPTQYTPAVYVGNDGKLRAQFWNGTAAPITTSGTVNNNQWHHVVLSGQGGTQTLYLDGSSVGSVSATIDHLNQPYVYVGYGWASSAWPQTVSSPGNYYFTGSIDDVAIYDKPLGLAAVRQHYAARLAAQQLTQVTLPSNRVHAVNTYDAGTDRLATHTDRNGGLWTLSAPAYSGTADTPIKTVTLGTPASTGSPTMTYKYDLLRGNRLMSETDQLGKTTSYGYDTGGHLGTITDPNGNQTALWYDERGNKRYQQRCRDTDTCNAEFWGYYLNTSDPLDPRNDQLTSYEDGRTLNAFASPYTTTWQYDTYGQQTTELWPQTDEFPGTHGIGYEYTAGTEPASGGGTTPAGLLKRQWNGGGQTTHSYTYTSAGDLATDTDAAGKLITYTYDALGRVLTKTDTSDAHPSGVTVTATYDGLDRTVTQTGPGVTNEITGVTHTAQIRYTYDVDSNVLTQTLDDTTGSDPDRVTTYTYDSHGRPDTITDPEGGIQSDTYDVTGARTKEIDPLGHTYALAYTTRGQLATRTLKNWTGHPDHPTSAQDLVVDSYAYDDGGRLASHTDSMGRTLTYTYYGDDLLAQTTATGVKLNGSTTTRDVVVDSRSYDGAGHLTSQVTGGGKNRIDYVYDEIGNRTAQIIDPGELARRTDYKLDADNNIVKTTLTDSATERQEVTSYTFDQLQRMLSRTVENGDEDLTTTLTRNQLGDITSTVDPRGNAVGATAADYTTTLRYDLAGQLVQVTEPPVQVERGGAAATQSNPTLKIGYNTAGERTQMADPEGRLKTIGYDKAGRVTSLALPSYTPPGGSAIVPTTTVSYDAGGQILQKTDPRGKATTYAYDALGNLAHVDEPQLSTENSPGRWSYDHDVAGEQLSETDPMGARTEATYDDLGRQITQTAVERHPSAAAYTTLLTYDDAGNLTQATRPAGDTTAFTINGAGEITEQTDPLGKVSTVDHDLAGRVIKTTDPRGRSVAQEYDTAGRMTASKDLDTDGSTLRTHTFGYDPTGNLTSKTTPEGKTSQLTYDAAGNLTQLVEPVSAGNFITTTFGYDADGERTRLTDGRGNATITTYNALGLRESVIEPSTPAHLDLASRTWTTTYDASGNPISEAKPSGVTVTRVFDELGRLTQQNGTGAAASTAQKTFGYDLAGNRLRVSAPGSDILTTYNDRGLPLTTSSPNGAGATFGYDTNGRLASRTDAAGTAAFTWNGNDELATTTDGITGGTATRSYDDAGRLTGVQYGTGGAQRTYTYDGLDRVKTDTFTSPTSTTLASVAYTYDKDDHVTGKTTTGTTGAGTNSYTYDDAGRLTQWTNPSGSPTEYTWDAAGNRTKAGSTTYIYDQRNRLTSDSTGTTYTYTGRGDLKTTSAGTTTNTLTFDAYDRLITDNGVTNTYDALDRLTTRTQGGTTTKFNYATDQNDPTALATASGTVTTAYGRDPHGDLLSTRVGSSPSLVLSDQHQDLTATVSQTGDTLTGSTAYDPFGGPTSTTGTAPGLGYQGEYTDPTTGRVDMHARWYTPGTGNFTSRDDWTLHPDPSVQTNHYTYANADPLGNTDPTGHAPCTTHPGGSGGGSGSLGRSAGDCEGGYWCNVNGSIVPCGQTPPDIPCNLRSQTGADRGCVPGGGGGDAHNGGGSSSGSHGSGSHGSGSSNGGGGGHHSPPPKPSPAQIQHQQVEQALNHPRPRPATKNPITQKQINKQRDAKEAGVQSVGSTNTPPAHPGLSQPDLGDTCAVGICAPGDRGFPGFPTFPDLSPLRSVLEDAGRAIGNLLDWLTFPSRALAAVIITIIIVGIESIWKHIWGENPVKDPITHANDGREVKGYAGHSKKRMAERGISEDMVEQTVANGKKMKGNSPGTRKYKSRKMWVVLNQDGKVVSVGWN
ncbi:LamG-like jellyroll fold domain-containing protein [Actinomadura scrupuli]|uniref:LamG-like jellyroll fold domain-containing protein n=1 Tax=Actinomadura scrupuli TaxID=559629 RepID=UPI003D9812B0